MKRLYVAASLLLAATSFGCAGDRAGSPDSKANQAKTAQPVTDAGEAPNPADSAAIQKLAAFIRAGHEMQPDPKLRGQHPIGHGCVLAAFAVSVTELPEQLRLGVFAEDRTFESLIRLSNGRVSDDRLPDVHGMAIKLLGVEGDKILPPGELGPESNTQDFVLADNPVFFARDAQHMLDFVEATAGKQDDERLQIVRQLAATTHPKLVGFQKPAGPSPLAMIYWSQTTYMLGDTPVKYLATPVEGFASGTELTELAGQSATFLQQAMVEQLTARGLPAQFEFFVQPQTDPATMPVNDASFEWTSTPVKVATITIAPQTLASEEQLASCESTSFSPWHSLAEHRPTGSINRARELIYRQSLQLRLPETDASPVEAEPQDESASGTSESQRPGADLDADVRRYIANNRENYDWFAHAANSFDGVPFILQRLLPELDPEIWGPPDENFESFGLFFAAGDEGRPLPTGLGWDPMVTNEFVSEIHKVSLTCGACHIGRVRLDDARGRSSRFETLVGGPNTQMDPRKYRRAFELTVEKRLSSAEGIAQTAAELTALIDAKEPGFFYRGWDGFDEQAEHVQRDLFASQLGAELAGLAGKISASRVSIDKQLLTNYSRPNHSPLDGGTPGQSDGSGDLIPKLLLYEALAAGAASGTDARETLGIYLQASYPALPNGLATTTDILSTWRQSDRVLGQIDGTVKSPFFRNIAAIIAIAANPQNVNARNADLSAEFLEDLPAPAYPFDIDQARAERGRELFEVNCAVCHRPRSTEIYANLGTDANRSKVLQPETFDLFVRNFVASVPEGFSYQSKGETVLPRQVPADEILINRSVPELQGYLAGPLDGIWARAPYLHNGSVPTLRHLLAPESNDGARPATFVRGSISYDRRNLGFAWQIERLEALRAIDPVASIFDTSWDGASNGGHDVDIEVEGLVRKLNWSGADDEDALASLLEFLKTR